MNSPLELLNQVTTATLLLDLKGQFYYLNASAEKAMGITAKNLIGKPFDYFIDKPTFPIYEWLTLLDSGETKIYDNKLIALNNEREIEAELCVQKIQIDDDFYLLIEWQDSLLTKRHQQEQELSRQQEIQSQLLQNLAHEIKTPLSGISGAAQLVELSSDDPEVSQIIQKEVLRLSELVDRMLLGQQTASRLITNIHEVIEDVLQFIQLKAPSNLKLKRDYDPSLPELEIAPEQIYQIFLNLAQNALDAMQNVKSPKLIFRTRITSEHPLVHNGNQAICISVIDNGAGIPEELKANIFFPMISGKNSSGLGLGIAQSLMQQHQGMIEFQSEAGKTQFHCYLPLKATRAMAGEKHG